MKTIAFINNKGGVGKSASAAAIMHMLAQEHGKKVLGVDMDPQGNLSNQYSDIDFLRIFSGILYGQLEKKDYMVDDLLLDGNMDPHLCIRQTNYENVDIIPSFLTLSETEERLKADVKTPQQFRLKAQLAKLQEEYDYCIIDCSPSVNILNINALVAADEVYMPTRCDGGSLVGLAMTANLINTVQSYNSELKIGGTFFTQWQGNKNVSKVTMELIKEIPQLKILPITIGVSKYLEENTFQQEPLLLVDKKRESNATKGYLELTKYILAEDRSGWFASSVYV